MGIRNIEINLDTWDSKALRVVTISPSGCLALLFGGGENTMELVLSHDPIPKLAVP